jgi:hypothetical protein
VTGAAQALCVLRDYVQRSTHWQEGGADRHAALLALEVLEDKRCRICSHMAEECRYKSQDELMPYDDDSPCPTCGADGGTTCGAQNCGLME